MCVGARVLVAGDPRGRWPREVRVGEGSSLWALRCERLARTRAFSSPLPSGSPEELLTTLVHSTGKARLPGRASAVVALEEEEEGGQGRPHTNLRTCSQAMRRSSLRESQRSLELWQEKASPARSRSPRRRAEADPAVPWRRRGAQPPARRAHGGDQARIGSCLKAEAPWVARRCPWC